MQSSLRIALFLLLVIGTVTVRGSDPSDSSKDHDSHRAPAVNRPKSSRGAGLFDFLRGNSGNRGPSFKPKPTKSTGGDDRGLNLGDALSPKPSKAAGSDGFGFDLEDALRPAVKPTDPSSGGDCQGNLVRKLGTVIDNQHQQLRLLMQLLAQSSGSPFNRRFK